MWLWPRGETGLRVALGTLPDWISNLSIDPDHRRVLAASIDGTIAIWDLDPPYSRRDVPWQKKLLGEVVVSPDGLRLAIITESGAAHLIDLETMEKIGGFHAGEAVLPFLAFSPNNRMVAMAGEEGILWLWKIGERPQALRGHAGWISALTFDPEGTRIATGSIDGTVRLWDTVGGQSLAVLRGHSARITDVDFAQDGRLLVSSADDGRIRVWEIERTITELRYHAKQMISR